MEEQKIYLYPKTLCPCGTCSEKKCDVPPGFRSNLSFPSGQVPECMDCYNRVMLGQQKQPVEQNGWTELNPQVYTEKFDPSFGKVPCPQPSGCEKTTFISYDPRLFSTTRMDYTVLDRPPINGNVQLDNVYNPKWDRYGGILGAGFSPYENIRDGDIEYYVDTSIQNAFFKPNFTTEAQEVGVIYRDPMGSIKPEYSRLPISNTENPETRCNGKDGKGYMYCLSWMDDSTSHREDIMSYQMRKRNQERWETRWSQQLNT